ncbi:MAG: hypothetical protein JWM16_1749 [Verrucomicrobiales bacterium]|nr:hypothetical protein [Verrucomicrobiales bacterium]
MCSLSGDFTRLDKVSVPDGKSILGIILNLNKGCKHLLKSVILGVLAGMVLSQSRPNVVVWLKKGKRDFC